MPYLRSLLVAVAAGSVIVAAAPAPAHAAATIPAAIWEMNEAAGATVMVDSSGNGLNGRIGLEVTTGYTFSGSTGYDFQRLAPNTPPAHPEHLVTVLDNAQLDPGTRDYAITVRFRTTHNFGNIIQKGQSGAVGGYFKWQAPRGFVQCMFRGSAGQKGVGSGRALNDGLWHVVRCERTATSVTMWVDGVRVARNTGPTGTISNTWPLSIGGKVNCDQIVVTCDYFPGEIDRVVIETS